MEDPTLTQNKTYQNISRALTGGGTLESINIKVDMLTQTKTAVITLEDPFGRRRLIKTTVGPVIAWAVKTLREENKKNGIY